MLEQGTQAPDFTLPGQDGSPVTLSRCAAGGLPSSSSVRAVATELEALHASRRGDGTSTWNRR
jgi:hypothetical protein